MDGADRGLKWLDALERCSIGKGLPGDTRLLAAGCPRVTAEEIRAWESEHSGETYPLAAPRRRVEGRVLRVTLRNAPGNMPTAHRLTVMNPAARIE